MKLTKLVFTILCLLIALWLFGDINYAIENNKRFIDEYKYAYQNSVGICQDFFENNYQGCGLVDLSSCYKDCSKPFPGSMNSGGDESIGCIRYNELLVGSKGFTSEMIQKSQNKPSSLQETNYCISCLKLDGGTSYINNKAVEYYCPKWIENAKFNQDYYSLSLRDFTNHEAVFWFLIFFQGY